MAEAEESGGRKTGLTQARSLGALPWVTLITLAAAFFRFYRLHEFPVGFHFDEAANVVDLWRFGLQYHPMYLTANNGREPLFFYWAAPFVDILKDVPFALRLASAFLGVATIPAVYFCFSQQLRKAEGEVRARRIALFAAAICAFLFVHLNFSRIGLRTISLPLFECLAFGLLWRAIRVRQRGLSVAAGVTLGLCLYTYTAARLLVPAVAIYGGYWLLAQRRIQNARELLASGLAFALTCLPLALYALGHPADFFQRTQGVAVLDRPAVLENVKNILEMFFIKGSINGAHNLIGMPLFDWPMRVAFVLGLMLLIPRLRHPAYVFAVIWLVAISLASVFSPDAPYYVRLTGLIPPAVLVPALALARVPDWISAALARLGPKQALVWSFAPSAAAVAASAGITYVNYFSVWGPSNDTYFWMMQDKVDAAAALNRWVSEGDSVFLAPLYARDWTFQALTRGQPIQSFDVQYCSVLPPQGHDAVYAFPPYDVTQPARLLPYLPPAAQEKPVLNPLSQPVLIQVRVPATALPAAASRFAGNFGNEIALVRLDGVPAEPVRPGSTLHLNFIWQSLSPAHADYTVFLHADDPISHRRIQRDGMPCGATFSTSRWRPGDQVADRVELPIPNDAAEGTYEITTGLYSLPGPHNLFLAGSDRAELAAGSFRVAAK